MKANNTGGILWAEMFLALLYAGTVLLFLAWISNIELANIPPQLEAIAHSGWTWVGAASSGALFSIIMGRTLSAWVLLLTVALVVGLAFAAYSLRKVKPVSPEHWSTLEGGGSPTAKGEWDVTFDDKEFDCSFAGTPAKCIATAWNDTRSVRRTWSLDKNQCSFYGHVSGPAKDQLSATYFCANGGPYQLIGSVSRKR